VSLLCKKMYIKVVLFIYKFVFYIKRYLARVITAGQLTLRSSSQRVQSPTQHLTAPNTPYMPCAHNSHTAPHSSQYHTAGLSYTWYGSTRVHTLRCPSSLGTYDTIISLPRSEQGIVGNKFTLLIASNFYFLLKIV